MNQITSILVLIASIIIAAALGVAIGFFHGTSVEGDRAAAEMAEHLAADRAAEAEAIGKVNDTNIDLTAAVNAAAQDAYKKGYQDAEAARARIVADLQSGSLQLRNHWAGCETQRLADSVTARAAAEQSARDREESAGRIVQAADQCDAQVIGLQNAYNGAKAIIDKHNEGSSRR